MRLKDNGLGEEALDMIAAEDECQRQKWGNQEHDMFMWLAIITEEVGELNKAYLQGGEMAIDNMDIEKEATQVATLALKVAWMARQKRKERER